MAGWSVEEVARWVSRQPLDGAEAIIAQTFREADVHGDVFTYVQPMCCKPCVTSCQDACTPDKDGLRQRTEHWRKERGILIISVAINARLVRLTSAEVGT